MSLDAHPVLRILQPEVRRLRRYLLATRLVSPLVDGGPTTQDTLVNTRRWTTRCVFVFFLWGRVLVSVAVADCVRRRQRRASWRTPLRWSQRRVPSGLHTRGETKMRLNFQLASVANPAVSPVFLCNKTSYFISYEMTVSESDFEQS